MDKKGKSVNQILEQYNIKQYLDNNVSLPSWTSETIAKYKHIASLFSKEAGEFFSQIDSTNIENYASSVDIDYTDDFWFLVTKYKAYMRIDSISFEKTLRLESTKLTDILHNKALVEHFGQSIADYMRDTPKTAEHLVSYYLEKYEHDKPRMYFPKELTPNMRTSLIDSYITSGDPNQNYLELISKAQSSSELPLPDKTIYTARKKYDEFIKEFFVSNSGMRIGIQVTFSRTQKNTIEYKDETERNGVFYVSYDTKWISENLDNPTLLNNFIYLFGYTDYQFRSQLPIKLSKISALERTLGIKGKNDYVIGNTYQLQSKLPLFQMKGYCELLENNGKRLEDIVSWFFDTYLPKEFGAMGFIFVPPSTGTTLLERMKATISEIDSILKQFCMYSEDGEINRELFEMSSKHIVFSQIPSMIKRKYYYPSGKEIQMMIFDLFSDQSMLGYIQRFRSKYSTLYELLSNENVELNELTAYQEARVKWLITQECVFLTNDGYIKIRENKVSVLKDLYENEVGCITYSAHIKPTLMKMYHHNEIRFNSTLFSEPEQKYLNYILNRSEFSDGLDLRNKYAHGTYPQNTDTHEIDYCILLGILITIVIKINEEFCIVDTMKRKENS